MDVGKKVTKKFKNDDIEVIYLGNKEGIKYYFRTLRNSDGEDELTSKFSVANRTSSNQTPSYTRETGSQYGFAETVGMKISGSAGIPFIAKGEVELSGSLTFSQAFHKVETMEIPITVQPGKIVTLFEAEIKVEYFYELEIKNLISQFRKYKSDIIETGSYDIVEEDITT